MVFGTGTLYTKRLLKHVPQWFWGFVMCCFFNKAYLRVPFDIIKQYKVILLYHCWNHVVFSFIVVKDAASHSTNYSLPRGRGGGFGVSIPPWSGQSCVRKGWSYIAPPYPPPHSPPHPPPHSPPHHHPPHHSPHPPQDVIPSSQLLSTSSLKFFPACLCRIEDRGRRWSQSMFVADFEEARWEVPASKRAEEMRGLSSCVFLLVMTLVASLEDTRSTYWRIFGGHNLHVAVCL